jgi:hypothetical protein
VRLQGTQANCGPAALRNALLCHGIIRSEQELETLTGCSAPSGTTGKGLLKALRAISEEHPGVTPMVIKESRGDVAMLKLRAVLYDGHVAVLCVDNFEHWAVAFGTLGRDICHISDSADSEMVTHLSWSEVMERWRGPEGSRWPFYAVVV